jgi:hypothetical protein
MAGHDSDANICVICEEKSSISCLGIERLMFEAQHRLNPLHIFCRLMGLGMGKRVTLLLCNYYETLIYKSMLIPITKISISLFRVKREHLN